MNIRRWRFVIAVTACLVMLTVTAWADEVEDAVKEALESYRSGDLSGAASGLDYASQLIRQKKGGELQSLLPKPLKGWTAEDATSESMGAAMFGGGVTAKRAYLRGDSRVEVEIVTDSPMLQGMMMMLTNPSFATADGGKLEKVKGQKAIVKYDAANRQGDVKIVVANRFLVSVEGSNVARTDLTGFAEAVDFQKLAAQP